MNDLIWWGDKAQLFHFPLSALDHELNYELRFNLITISANC